MKSVEPFAQHGSEKMIYDIRMGPQCLHHDGAFYAVYQSNPENGKALPHVIKRDQNGMWTTPIVLGDVSNYDHHFAPILWIDAQQHFHVVYHCHGRLNEARHKISTAPLDITLWRDGPPVTPSISYPRLLNCPSGQLLLYYRTLGHMGYWTYQISDDGGYTWQRPDVPLVDFDYRPEVPGDEWAGSYHSVALGHDGKSLHMAFVYWDERKQVHPLYKRTVGHMNRYNLYYMRLDLSSKKIYNVSGDELQRPVNRGDARKCLVVDTKNYLTNMPSILIDTEDHPSFLVPISGETLTNCAFWFVRREGNKWSHYRVTDANSAWNGSHLEYGANGGITAFLIARPQKADTLPYGGGLLQEWHSADHGQTWTLSGEIVPQNGILCNNPKPVEDLKGALLKRTLVFYGWEGPDGILPEGKFRGNVYVWQDGAWL
ncbi:BNR repeat-containing protein [Chloroflexi bacterium TSY]|nr:BNR repeat-containing protein [Chloroflexi bacterium TSY]